MIHCWIFQIQKIVGFYCEELQNSMFASPVQNAPRECFLLTKEFRKARESGGVALGS